MTTHADSLMALRCLDLTSLNDNDNDNEQCIRRLIDDAQTPFGDVAAICIYPQFIELAKSELLSLRKDIDIATVVNFPNGNNDIETVVHDTQKALSFGANEIDIVLPYKSFMKGDKTQCREIIKATRSVCETNIALKVIIESGELQSESLIRSASELAIESGANFVKTSTGKTQISATLEAVEFILQTLKESSTACGLKVSGGVKTSLDALSYLQLVQRYMGQDWIKPSQFRFGASSLLTNLICALKGEDESQVKGY